MGVTKRSRKRIKNSKLKHFLCTSFIGLVILLSTKFVEFHSPKWNFLLIQLNQCLPNFFPFRHPWGLFVTSVMSHDTQFEKCCLKRLHIAMHPSFDDNIFIFTHSKLTELWLNTENDAKRRSFVRSPNAHFDYCFSFPSFTFGFHLNKTVLKIHSATFISICSFFWLFLCINCAVVLIESNRIQFSVPFGNALNSLILFISFFNWYAIPIRERSHYVIIQLSSWRYLEHNKETNENVGTQEERKISVKRRIKGKQNDEI